MAISGADSARVNAVLTTTLDKYSPQISNELARNDGIIAIFGVNGRIKVNDGGERAVETLDVAENPNIDFRSQYSDIPVSRGDSRQQAKYAYATVDGAIAINKIDEAMNSGTAKIYDLVEAEIMNAKNTLVRKVADALRAASPGASSPESIRTICPATATASQTTTTGELSRSTNSWWRSQYNSTGYTLNATAGLQGITGFYLDSCSKGAAKREQPDFGLTTGLLFAALAAGHGDARRLLPANTKMLELGFTNLVVQNATIISDPSVVAGYLYFINTEYCQLQALRTPNMKDIGDRPQTLPVSVGDFNEAYNSLHRVALIYLTFALTCSSLQRQGLMSGLS